MIDTRQAIYDRLTGDATLTGLLATYTGVSPAVPCVFTQSPVPPDAPRPLVYASPAVSAAPFVELSDPAFGLDVSHDIFVYTDAGSADDPDAIAWQVAKLFDRAKLAIPGGTSVLTRVVLGPVAAPTDSSLQGRQVVIRVVTMEA